MLVRVDFAAVSLLILTRSICSALEFAKFHSNEEMEMILKEFVYSTNDVLYPGLKSEIRSIGKTWGERICTHNCTGRYIPNDLWVVSLTASRKEYGVPNVKLIGSIHGNEPVGKEILLHFLYYLRSNYGKDNMVSHLLNTTKIHILPCLNPDGYERAYVDIDNSNIKGRENGRALIDLDSNFRSKHFWNYNSMTANEAQAVEGWMNNVTFVLSISLHSGTRNVVYYPYETSKAKSTSDPEQVPHKTPDNDVFERLATTYKTNWEHRLFNDSECDNSEITVINGAEWSSTNGAMADYNYDYRGCMEVSVQIGCSKYPDESKLEDLWKENQFALVNYLLEAHRGITGRIYDETNLAPIKATLQISGRNATFWSSEKTGEFWRILLDGNYSLQITAPGYHSKSVQFSLPYFKPNTSLPELRFLNISMLNASFSTTTISTTTYKTTSVFPQKSKREGLTTTAVPEISDRILEDTKNSGSALKSFLLMTPVWVLFFY